MSLLKRIGGVVPSEAQPAAQRQGSSTQRFDTPGRPAGNNDEAFNEIKMRVQNRLINELDPKLDLANKAKVRKQVEETFNTILDGESIVMTRGERTRLFETIEADIIGLGPLEQLLSKTRNCAKTYLAYGHIVRTQLPHALGACGVWFDRQSV